MKIKIISLLLVVTLLFALAVGCGSGSTEGDIDTESIDQSSSEDKGKDDESDPDEKITIGVSFATEVQLRWKYDEKFMTEKAEELGADIVFQWANYDANKQTNQVENLLSQDIDALIFVGVDAKMSNVVETVKEHGIPIIGYDQIIEDAPLDAMFDRDNRKVGRIQMEAALDYTGGKGNFALIKGNPASTVAQDIADVYHEVLKEYPDVNVVAEQFHQGWSPEKALETAENALSANNDDIQAFVVSNDGMAQAIIPALKANGLDGKVFVSGMDVEVPNCRSIVEGVQTMSVWTMIDEGAKQAVEVAYKLAKDETIEPDEVIQNGRYELPLFLMDVVAITKDNMDEFIEEIAPEGWITKEEVYE